MERKNPGIGNTTLKENKFEGPTRPDFKIRYKTTTIRTAKAQTNTSTEQNREPRSRPYTCSPLTSDKEQSQDRGAGIVSSANGASNTPRPRAAGKPRRRLRSLTSEELKTEPTLPRRA